VLSAALANLSKVDCPALEISSTYDGKANGDSSKPNRLLAPYRAFGNFLTRASRLAQQVSATRVRDWCDDAKLRHCSAHGLRKAAAVRHALNGATTPELMAWFGWKSIGEAQRYIEEANRIELAASAGAKIISGTAIGSPPKPVGQNEAQAVENIGGGK